MSELEIRPATDDDLPAVLALYGQPGMDDGVVLDIESAKALHAKFKAYPDYTLYVAEQDGVVLGTYAMLIMDNLGHMGAPSAIVEDVNVSPEAQGKGMGSQMIRHALDVATAKGCYKLSLSSNMKRERAHAFYDGLGFERHGYSFLCRLNNAEASHG